MFKGSSKKGQRIYGMYLRNEGYYLDDVYGRYSPAKSRAWRDCNNWYQNDYEASNFHICSHNDQNFTVGWTFVDVATGHKMVRVETSRYSYIVDMDE